VKGYRGCPAVIEFSPVFDYPHERTPPETGRYF